MGTANNVNEAAAGTEAATSTAAQAQDAGAAAKVLSQEVISAVTQPFVKYLLGIKANPTVATIVAGAPALAADEIAISPTLEGEAITAVADFLLSHLAISAPIAQAAPAITSTAA